jgi:hypothetical protein
MCGHFNGTLHEPGICALDFSYVDRAGFLRLIKGLDTAGQLCNVLKGESSDHQCIIDLKVSYPKVWRDEVTAHVCLQDTTAGGGGSDEVRKEACRKLQGTWGSGKCEVLGFTGKEGVNCYYALALFPRPRSNMYPIRYEVPAHASQATFEASDQQVTAYEEAAETGSRNRSLLKTNCYDLVNKYIQCHEAHDEAHDRPSRRQD